MVIILPLLLAVTLYFPLSNLWTNISSHCLVPASFEAKVFFEKKNFCLESWLPPKVQCFIPTPQKRNSIVRSR